MSNKCQECSVEGYQPTQRKQITRPKNRGCNHFYLCYDCDIRRGGKDVLLYRCVEKRSQLLPRNTSLLSNNQGKV